ncbi:hypothetical protein AB9P05_12000 [Roseivirga sp. BDSF3-8]|uniref:hypothetical protein n=1 Tax=Roseivirga sp. BDSF3-8 TaxID=3241598 RepID=UPI0035319C8B
MKKKRLQLSDLKISSFVSHPIRLKAGGRALADTEPCSPRCALTEWDGCEKVQ